MRARPTARSNRKLHARRNPRHDADNNDADYVKAFPTGADYGKEASKWLAAIRAAYPAAAISVVGVPSYRSGNDPRLTGWNKGLFSTLTGARAGDGVTMHEYDPTGAGAGKTVRICVV